MNKPQQVILPQLIEFPQEPIDKSPQPIEKVDENADLFSFHDVQLSIPTKEKERCGEESKPTSVSTPTNETETIPAFVPQEEVEVKGVNEMEVEQS